MTRQEVLLNLAEITERINMANECVRLYNIEIRKLNKKKKEIKKELCNSSVLSMDVYTEIIDRLNETDVDIAEMKSLKQSAEEDLAELRQYLCDEARVLFEQFNGEIYNYEFNKLLEDKTGLKWQDQWIYDNYDRVVGVALVSENDPNFNKKIVSEEISISKNEAKLENSDTLKVILTDIGGDAVVAYQNWDWMKMYLYTTTGFYTNERMRVHYYKFLEKDRTFVENLCEMIFNEYIGEKEVVFLNESEEECI